MNQCTRMRKLLVSLTKGVGLVISNSTAIIVFGVFVFAAQGERRLLLVVAAVW